MTGGGNQYGLPDVQSTPTDHQPPQHHPPVFNTVWRQRARLKEFLVQSRRDFLSLMPLAGSTLLGACGGGASGDAANAGGNAAVEGTATATAAANGASKVAPNMQKAATTTADQIPAYVVVEDWSSGVAVDAGRIDFTTLIREDRFADPALAADCTGWTEHGPSSISSLPILNGVQFSAKRFTIQAGGQYTQVSYRVLVVMRALGLKDGLFGDVRGVRTFPGPHKLRITTLGGLELKRIEMRDGLPINHPSLINVPFEWTVTDRPAGVVMPSVAATYTPRLPKSSPMRPHMSAGSSYVAFFGDTPTSSARTRGRIPRVRSDIWPSKNSKVRHIYNGFDMHAWGGNGFNHPEVMPQWPMSDNAASAVDSVAPNDAEVVVPVGYNWTAAMVEGWDYEPGALGGITRRGGPGGVRPDRTVLPAEIFQMALAQSVRTGDGTSTAAMARGHALNQANYPGYYPRDMLSLDAINTYSNDPQPSVSGRSITPILHYYGGSYQGRDNEVWICDTYGDSVGAIAQSIEFANPALGTQRTNASHVRNGWVPEGEHNVRVGTAWSALLFADPLFAKMAEHMMLESSIFAPVISRSTWNLYGGSPQIVADDPGMFWQSRSNVLPFCVATMMWWVASTQGVYTRALIEERMHGFFRSWKTEILDIMPSGNAITTASVQAFQMTGGLRVSWQEWNGVNNFAAGSGWVASFGLYSMYLGHFLLLLKASGLLSVLKQNPTTAACIADLERQLEFHARVTATCPWAVCTDIGGSPSIILRTSAQGATQTDVTTVPTRLAQVVANNPARRADRYWFLNETAIPGVSTPSLQGNYAAYGRLQSALLWWDYFAPAGDERAAGKLAVESLHVTLGSYTPTVYDPAFTRHNFFQTVPNL